MGAQERAALPLACFMTTQLQDLKRLQKMRLPCQETLGVSWVDRVEKG